MTGADRGLKASVVAFFDAYPHSYAGAQQLSHRLALDLPAHGWRARFVLPAGGEFAERLRADGVEVAVVPAPAALSHYGGSTRGARVAAAALAMPGWTRRLRAAFAGADVVHANGPRGVLIAGPAARLAGSPLVWHLQVVSSRPRINRLGAALANETVVVSDSSLAAMPELDGRAVVEPNPMIRERLGPGPANPGPVPTVVTAARLHPDKGIDVLVEAMKRIGVRHPQARLVIFGKAQPGSESYAERLREQAGREGLAGRVEFRGWVERPADHWGEAWVYAQPSRPASESYCLALLEALASGLPAVASDVPGLRERISDGRTGILVPPEDAATLAEALDRLLTDRALAARLGGAGRTATLAAAVEPAAFAERWARRYERLVRGR